jgi:hypothetical protein
MLDTSFERNHRSLKKGNTFTLCTSSGVISEIKDGLQSNFYLPELTVYV